MRMITGMIRWMASHHRKLNLRHRARHTPKGRVRRKVTDRRVTSIRGEWGEKSIGPL
jgi:hypothetical protein